MKLSVILPTYNQAENLSVLISELERVLAGIDYEIVISDDDSPDLTWAIAERIARQNPRVRVLRRTRNRGLANSVIEGFTCATGDVLACIDADLQHDPGALPRMLEELMTGSDLVVATRCMSGGGTAEWGWMRRLQSWGATKIAKTLLGMKLRDPMSGYFLMRREDFLRVCPELHTDGFKILLEIATKLKPHAIREVPYIFRSRSRGESKLSANVVYSYLRQLWRLSFLDNLLPAEFVKFAVVGGTGVIVNLAVMAALLHATQYRDWRASALASIIATVTNYIFNNFWTFRDRCHSGKKLVSSYLYYLLASLTGLIATTASYAAITSGLGIAIRLNNSMVYLHEPGLLACQFCAILVGTFFNYSLNRMITWPLQSSEKMKTEGTE